MGSVARMKSRTPDSLPESDHERVKGLLRPALAHWCNRVCEGVKRGERNAMNNWARAMGVAGAQIEITIAMQRELGMGIDQARRLIESASSVDGISDLDALAMMEHHLREHYRRQGKIIMIVDDADEVPALTNGNGKEPH
jgi:hypothetical protein